MSLDLRHDGQRIVIDELAAIAAALGITPADLWPSEQEAAS